MRTIYIADDGSIFDDEYKCKDYEWKLDHPHLKDVSVYDVVGVKLEDLFSEDTYQNSDRIVVTSDEAVKDLQALADYTGYCGYETINSVGEWVFDDHEETFVLNNKGE